MADLEDLYNLYRLDAGRQDWGFADIPVTIEYYAGIYDLRRR